MTRARRALAVVLVATAAAAEPPPTGARTGLNDPSHFLDAGWSKAIGGKCDDLHAKVGLDLAVVIERQAQAANGSTGAQTWLAAWERAGSAGAADQVPRRVVVHIDLARHVASVAVNPVLDQVLPPDKRKELVTTALQPALEARSTERLASALVDAARRIGTAAGMPPDSPAHEPPPPASTVGARPARSPLNLLWFVLLPTLIFGVVFARREGPRALWMVPCTALLYGGTYLVACFQPQWFMGLGAAAVAPVVMWLTLPPARAAMSPAWRGPAPGFVARRGGAFGLGGW
ncbi:MAG: TPM domain-containing protein [Armatimonadetes bacterium]|nr:TPM domain-containing protein [Armatimonadota bacterium]